MKKFLLGILLPLLAISSFAQDKIAAKQLVLKSAKEIKMNEQEVNNFFVSDAYTADGITMVYANQEYKNVPVMNQMYVLSFRGEKLLSSTGGFIQNMESATAGKSAVANVSASTAAKNALQEKKIQVGNLPAGAAVASNKYNMGKVAGVTEDIVATLLWVQLPFSSDVKLAWQVQVVPAGADDYWLVNIDAHTGTYINELNLTVYEQFNKGNQTPALLKHYNDATSKPAITNTTTVSNATTTNNFVTSPTIVNNASYSVIPYPLEAPNFGAVATVTNPWAAAPGNATTLGWHSDGTTDYNITRGNNVWATEDRAASNANNGQPATSTNPTDPLSFLFTPNFNSDPTTTAFQRFTTTNLFYLNNIIHDITYQHGFTETAGNFQRNNQGRGGNQNDDVIGLAQSGSGTNNANFATPADGGRGRMRMYLFDPAPAISFTINTPAPIAGTYEAIESAFSTANKICNLGAVSGQLVYFNDASGGTHDACNGAPSNSLTGKIALINRNVCGFTIKVKEAQDAGAIAVIMVNNVPGAPIPMGGTDNTITIPAFMVSDVNGALFAAQIGNNVTLTVAGTGCFNLDGDLDAGIVYHEFGHGVSNRFTGGPSAAGCLQNAEQGGEGWSDYIGLMLTTNWANANVNSGTVGRGVGTYVFGQTPTGGGIRLFRYSTDMAVNPLTYASMGVAPVGTEVHNTGEVWCAAIWEMTWGLIQQSNSIDPNLYNYNPTNNAGNIVAFKLVMEGMKLQPCSPGFIDARNAILAADRNLYNGSHACTIWTAFAKRGMGFGSSQGSSNSATDQTSTTTIPPAPAVSAQPTDVTVLPGATASFTASAGTDPNLIYQWQVSTDNGANWTDIVGQISATLTLTNVQSTMSNNLYRARVFYACAFTNTNSAKLTVTGAPTLPVISTQPSNVAACSGTNATFTVVATGAVSYAWQVSTNAGVTFTNIAPAVTTATLTLNAVTVAMNNNQYRVIVTNANGSVTSTAATLTVSAASVVAITVQPQPVSVCSGTNAGFSVTTTGVPVSYVWQVSVSGGAFTDISPAVTTSTLNLTAVTTAMSGNQYRVVVTGGCPVTTTNSTAATLTVNNAVVTITTQPANVTVCAPAAATFTAAATGTNLSYQWQLSIDNGANYNNILGATAATYNTGATTTAMNNNRYRVVVTNACNPAGIVSTAAILTVGNTAAITVQPAPVATCAGTNAVFSATVTGLGATYQWQVSTNGGTSYTNIAGATSTTLTLTAVTTAMSNNRYQLVVTGNCNSVTSTSALLTVNTSATITQQPTNISACADGSANLTVVATGTTITYQWQVSLNGGPFVNVVNAAPYNGATTATLNINPLTAALSGNIYRVLVSGVPCGSVTSNSVTLNINPKPSVVLSAASVINSTPSSAAVATPGAQVILSNTISPAGLYSIVWFKNGAVVPGVITSQYQLDANEFGTYYSIITNSLSGCAQRSNDVTVTAQGSSTVFVFPNPNNGNFQVRYYNSGSTSVDRTINVYDSKGARVYSRKYSIAPGPYAQMDIQLNSQTAKGIYIVELRDAGGKLVGTSRILVN